jgi:tetratricopeptide (TPR) repeat protein
MENDINQKILEELQRLRKTIQWTSAVSLLVLAGVCLWAFVLVPSRQASRASPWTDVSAAMHQYDYPKALKLAQQLAAAHPDDYYSHYYLGWIYVEMGDLARGEAEYSRAYQLWPSEDMQKRLEVVRKRKSSEATKTN